MYSSFLSFVFGSEICGSYCLNILHFFIVRLQNACSSLYLLLNTVLFSDVCTSFCFFKCFSLIIAPFSIRGITKDSGLQYSSVYFKLGQGALKKKIRKLFILK